MNNIITATNPNQTAIHFWVATQGLRNTALDIRTCICLHSSDWSPQTRLSLFE